MTSIRRSGELRVKHNETDREKSNERKGFTPIIALEEERERKKERDAQKAQCGYSQGPVTSWLIVSMGVAI